MPTNDNSAEDGAKRVRLPPITIPWESSALDPPLPWRVSWESLEMELVPSMRMPWFEEPKKPELPPPMPLILLAVGSLLSTILKSCSSTPMLPEFEEL